MFVPLVPSQRRTELGRVMQCVPHISSTVERIPPVSDAAIINRTTAIQRAFT